MKIIIRIACLICFVCVGCTKDVDTLDQQDKDHSLAKKGALLVEVGKIDEAVALYLELLDKDPSLARIHLEVALLLDDSKDEKDYFRSIYHFNRYLDLRPESEKNEMIQTRMKVVKKAIVDNYVSINAVDVSPGVSVNTKEIDELKDKLKDLKKKKSSLEKDLKETIEAHNKQLEAFASGNAGGVKKLELEKAELKQKMTDKIVVLGKANSAMKKELERLRVENVDYKNLADQRGEVIRKLKGIESGTNTGGAGGRAPNTVAGRHRTYRVSSGDTLSSIASKMYGSSVKWKVIRDANLDLLGSGNRLRVGQILVIPPEGE